MPGDDRQPDAMFSYVSAAQRVPQDHLGHLLIENRYGLIADAMATMADALASARPRR